MHKYKAEHYHNWATRHVSSPQSQLNIELRIIYLKFITTTNDVCEGTKNQLATHSLYIMKRNQHITKTSGIPSERNNCSDRT